MPDTYRPVFPESHEKARQSFFRQEDVVYEDGERAESIRSLGWKILADEDMRAARYSIRATHAETGERVMKSVSSTSLLSVADCLLHPYRCDHLYYPDKDAVMLRVKDRDGGAILVFLNGIEPENGAAPLESVFPEEGDTVMVAYAEKSYWDGHD